MDLARGAQACAALVDRCRIAYDLGLLEWRMITEFAVGALKIVPVDQVMRLVMRLTYGDLVSDPRTALADERPCPHEIAIGGPWLGPMLAS